MTARCMVWVESVPQLLLMLVPSGATPMGTTSAPNSHSTVGATL